MPAIRTKAGKRVRVNFNPKQLEAMEKIFHKTQYPDPKILSVLSENLDIPMEKICTWFQNRRSKFRKESKNGHIDWMRQQLYTESDPGGLGLLEGPARGQGGARVSPQGSSVLSAPTSPGDGSPTHGTALPSLPTPPGQAAYTINHPGYQYKPYWLPLTPPGELHVHTGGVDNYSSSQSASGTTTTTQSMTSSMTSSAAGCYINSMSSFADLMYGSGGFQPYGTLLSACNPPPTSQDSQGACAYPTGTGISSWAAGSAEQSGMTSSGGYPSSGNHRWGEQYDRYQGQQLPTFPQPSFNQTT